MPTTVEITDTTATVVETGAGVSYGNLNPPNKVLAAPPNGSPGPLVVRSLVPSDLPAGTSVSQRIIYASQIAGVILDCDLTTGAKIGGGIATDNAAAINAVLATASATNQLVLMIDGSSLIGVALKIAEVGRTTIRGLGRATGFFVKSGANCNAIESAGPITQYDHYKIWFPDAPQTIVGSDVQFRNFMINGNRGTYPNGNCGGSNDGTMQAHGFSPAPDVRGTFPAQFTNVGISLVGIDRYLFEDLYIYDAPSYAINRFHCQNGDVIRCQFSANGRPINTDGDHGNGGCTNHRVNGCLFQTGDDAQAINAGEGDRTGASRIISSNNIADDCSVALRVFGSVAGTDTKQIIVENYVGKVFTKVCIYGLEGTAGTGAATDANHSLTLTNFCFEIYSDPNGCCILLATSGGQLILNNFNIINPQVTWPLFKSTESNVDCDIAVNGVNIYRSAAGSKPSYIANMSAGRIGRASLNNYRITQQVDIAMPPVDTEFKLSGTAQIDNIDIGGGCIFTNVGQLYSLAGNAKIGSIGGKGLLESGFIIPDSLAANDTRYISSDQGNVPCYKDHNGIVWKDSRTAGTLPANFVQPDFAFSTDRGMFYDTALTQPLGDAFGGVFGWQDYYGSAVKATAIAGQEPFPAYNTNEAYKDAIALSFGGKLLTPNTRLGGATAFTQILLLRYNIATQFDVIVGQRNGTKGWQLIFQAYDTGLLTQSFGLFLLKTAAPGYDVINYAPPGKLNVGDMALIAIYHDNAGGGVTGFAGYDFVNKVWDIPAPTTGLILDTTGTTPCIGAAPGLVSPAPFDLFLLQSHSARLTIAQLNAGLLRIQKRYRF